MLDQIIGQSWVPVLQQEFNSEYLQKLSAWLAGYRSETSVKTVYPASEDVFRALKLCPYGQVKVVILGQDPYHDGQADGLAFSYKNGLSNKKQSLEIILDEAERDCYEGFNPGRDYQLDYLAKQGVLLLNSCLTVFKGSAGSHRNFGWERFTSQIIASQIREPSPKVFLLWGKEAQQTFELASNPSSYNNGEDYYTLNIGLMRHLVLKAPHPASDLYKRDQFGDITVRFPDGFTGCKHFSQANEFLLRNGVTAIDWFPIEEPFFNIKLSDKPPF
jgi:uracil-DNA glycosylase